MPGSRRQRNPKPNETAPNMPLSTGHTGTNTNPTTTYVPNLTQNNVTNTPAQQQSMTEPPMIVSDDQDNASIWVNPQGAPTPVLQPGILNSSSYSNMPSYGSGNTPINLTGPIPQATYVQTSGNGSSFNSSSNFADPALQSPAVNNFGLARWVPDNSGHLGMPHYRVSGENSPLSEGQYGSGHVDLTHQPQPIQALSPDPRLPSTRTLNFMGPLPATSTTLGQVSYMQPPRLMVTQPPGHTTQPQQGLITQPHQALITQPQQGLITQPQGQKRKLDQLGGSQSGNPRPRARSSRATSTTRPFFLGPGRTLPRRNIPASLVTYYVKNQEWIDLFVREIPHPQSDQAVALKAVCALDQDSSVCDIDFAKKHKLKIRPIPKGKHTLPVKIGDKLVQPVEYITVYVEIKIGSVTKPQELELRLASLDGMSFGDKPDLIVGNRALKKLGLLDVADGVEAMLRDAELELSPPPSNSENLFTGSSSLC